MRMPRLKVRHLMLAVALLAPTMVAMRPLWRYWFASPTRVVVYQGSGTGPVRSYFDTRIPGHAAKLESFKAGLDSLGVSYHVERTAGPYPLRPDGSHDPAYLRWFEEDSFR